MQDVRRVRPHVGPKIIDAETLRQLGEVVDQFLLRRAPRVVRVRLREAEFRQPVHDLRPRERLGQEDDIGMLALHFGNSPFPKGEGLGMRVVDAKNLHAFADPVIEHALQSGPHGAPVVALEIERINVLVLLRRVLGVLDGAVGAPAKPLRMGLYPGMIGRALKCNVKGDFDAMRRCSSDQVTEIFSRPQRGQDRLVPALRRANGPRAADIAGLRHQAVIPPLAVHETNRMDRREIQHVEAHARNGRKPRLDILEGTVDARLARCRAREQFVPGTEASTRALGGQGQLDGMTGLEPAVGIARHDCGHFLVQRQCFQRVRRHCAGSVDDWNGGVFNLSRRAFLEQLRPLCKGRAIGTFGPA